MSFIGLHRIILDLIATYLHTPCLKTLCLGKLKPTIDFEKNMRIWPRSALTPLNQHVSTPGKLLGYVYQKVSYIPCAFHIDAHPTPGWQLFHGIEL